jgi:hypothetical protein
MVHLGAHLINVTLVAAMFWLLTKQTLSQDRAGMHSPGAALFGKSGGEGAESGVVAKA